MAKFDRWEMTDRMRLLVHAEPWFGSYGILLCMFNFEKKISHFVELAEDGENFIISENNNRYPINSTFNISTESAQELMNELWKCGIRPTNGAGNAGHIEAISRHLEDMRTLVFKKGQ